jgi:hypothetical protein
METIKTVKFSQWDCLVIKGQYRNNRVALSLVAASDDPENDISAGEPIATATVNLVNEDIPDGYAAIKDYSENEGMLDALVKAGIVETPTKYSEQGMPICKLLI